MTGLSIRNYFRRATAFAQRLALLLPPVFLIAAALWMQSPAWAQPKMPACNSANLGIVHCIEGVLCLCRHEQASLLRGLEAGYRWQCDVNRPYCEQAGANLNAGGSTVHWPREVEAERNGQNFKLPIIHPK